MKACLLEKIRDLLLCHRFFLQKYLSVTIHNHFMIWLSYCEPVYPLYFVPPLHAVIERDLVHSDLYRTEKWFISLFRTSDSNLEMVITRSTRSTFKFFFLCFRRSCLFSWSTLCSWRTMNDELYLRFFSWFLIIVRVLNSLLSLIRCDLYVDQDHTPKQS